ncbi:glutathione S-transferase protein [Rutstroemia sp. NJR-2017a BBW]|nr:glutathione S-transferase protein [Rutstroemia sp. NJR-2017a BBW]
MPSIQTDVGIYNPIVRASKPIVPISPQGTAQLCRAEKPEIILYHYRFSPFAKRVVWYMNLRGIPYTQCLQAPVMPRPDVAALGTNYRRIPLVAIGRDIYNDTRLILQKLEKLYPEYPKITASSPDQKAVERLLEFWTVESLFTRAASLIPTNLPLLNDPVFTKDREDYTGRSWAKDSLDKSRPEALVAFRRAFEILENTFLADGRDWILGSSSPTMSDIEGMGLYSQSKWCCVICPFANVLWCHLAVWPFHWLSTMKGALPDDYISPAQFPKTFAWIKRFDEATRIAASKVGKPKNIVGLEATKLVSGSSFAESGEVVDAKDPTGLQQGQEVEVWPVDSGMNYKDTGKLVGLTTEEIVIESHMKDGEKVKVHTPRHGFRIRAANGGSSSAKL